MPLRSTKDARTRHAEQTHASILRAAIAEFSRGGVAGARTDKIARAAGVNKALLYYYFKDKQALYAAVLEYAFGNVYSKLMGILDSDRPPGERILGYAATHFDALAENPRLCRVLYSEMTRMGGAGHPRLDVVARYRKQLVAKLQSVLREGIASGEFRPVDPMHFTLSMAAVNVFYFVSAPMFKAITGLDPFAPERIAARRAAVLDLISHALFTSPVKDTNTNGRRKARKREDVS